MTPGSIGRELPARWEDAVAAVGTLELITYVDIAALEWEEVAPGAGRPAHRG